MICDRKFYASVDLQRYLAAGGVPFSLSGRDEDDAIFPCDVSLGTPCRGSITCSPPDILLLHIRAATLVVRIKHPDRTMSAVSIAQLSEVK